MEKLYDRCLIEALHTVGMNGVNETLQKAMEANQQSMADQILDPMMDTKISV